MRLGDFNIPLFTRDRLEGVPRYLLHQSRTLLKSFRETSNAVNDNETALRMMEMRGWWNSGYGIHPRSGRQITEIPASSTVGSFNIVSSPGFRFRRVVHWVSVYHAGPTSTSYQIEYDDGSSQCRLTSVFALGTSAGARKDGPYVLEPDETLNLYLMTNHTGSDSTLIVAYYADVRLPETQTNPIVQTTGCVTMGTGTGEMTAVAAPGYRFIRTVPYVCYWNVDLVSHTVWLLQGSSGTQPILEPGSVTLGATAVQRWEGPFVLTDSTSDELRVYKNTATMSNDPVVYAPIWEERIPESRAA